MIKKYNINDYLKDDKELQKTVIQKLITENEKLKQALEEIRDLNNKTVKIPIITEKINEVLTDVGN